MSKELPKGHDISAHKDIVGQTMHRWKHHDPKPLHSGRGKGGKEGKIVTDPKQAIAISLSIAEKAKTGKGKKGERKTADHSERLQALGFSEEVSNKVSEMLEGEYDFTLCVRPDGSSYGTGGRCRKGIESKGPSLNEQIRDAYEREQAARRAGDTEGARAAMREHMNLVKQLESGKKLSEGQGLNPKKVWADLKSRVEALKPRKEEEVRRPSGLLIGDSPRNMAIKTVQEYHKRLLDSRSEAETKLLKDLLEKSLSELEK